jgi:hypothetical protein
MSLRLRGPNGGVFFPCENTATYETKLLRFFRCCLLQLFAQVLLEHNSEHQIRWGIAKVLVGTPFVASLASDDERRRMPRPRAVQVASQFK